MLRGGGEHPHAQGCCRAKGSASASPGLLLAQPVSVGVSQQADFKLTGAPLSFLSMTFFLLRSEVKRNNFILLFYRIKTRFPNSTLTSRAILKESTAAEV